MEKAYAPKFILDGTLEFFEFVAHISQQKDPPLMGCSGDADAPGETVIGGGRLTLL